MANLNRKHNLLERFVEYRRLIATKCKESCLGEGRNQSGDRTYQNAATSPSHRNLTQSSMLDTADIVTANAAAAVQPSALNLINSVHFSLHYLLDLKFCKAEKWLTIDYVLILNINE